MEVRAIVALQVPTGDGFLTVAVENDSHLLREFRDAVLARYEYMAKRAETATERAIRERRLAHMRDLLDLLVPQGREDGDLRRH